MLKAYFGNGVYVTDGGKVQLDTRAVRQLSAERAMQLQDSIDDALRFLNQRAAMPVPEGHNPLAVTLH